MKLTRRDRRVAEREPVRTPPVGGGVRWLGDFRSAELFSFFSVFFFFFYHTWWCISVVCLVTISLRRILFYVGTYIEVGGLPVCIYRSVYASFPSCDCGGTQWPPAQPVTFWRGEVYNNIKYIYILYTRTKERWKRKNKNRLLSLFFDARVDAIPKW